MIDIPGWELVATRDLLAVYRLVRDVTLETIEKAPDETPEDDPTLAGLDIGLAFLESEIERMELKITTSSGTSAEGSSTESGSP